jgi:hypothetical protein
LKKISYIFIFLLFILGCKTKQVATETIIQESKPAPLWVSARPNNGFKFVGIGFADKKPGTNYQMEAKKNALYDLSSEIKVDISSNSVLYTVQNNQNFNENFNSLIKLSSTDNIEGYNLIDSYENEKQYWVYYSLDKQEYANLKAKKKQLTISKATNLITASFIDEKNADFSSALKKRIQAFSVLTPYLSEEINFDPTQTQGLKNVFDLTNLIQQQLQTISVSTSTLVYDIKPFQPKYPALDYQLLLNGKLPLQNFPFTISSEDQRIRVQEKAATNNKGNLQLKITEVEPINQYISFSLNPDVMMLLGSDSVSQTALSILKQFIQTNTLKLQAKVTNINLYLSVTQKNFGKETTNGNIISILQAKFKGQEISLVDKAELADFIIEVQANTQEDLSSDILDKSYNIKLASLNIQLLLINKLNAESTFKRQVNEIYGYANSLEKAGLNAYDNPKLNSNLSEALFYIKRKMLVY